MFRKFKMIYCKMSLRKYNYSHMYFIQNQFVTNSKLAIVRLDWRMLAQISRFCSTVKANYWKFIGFMSFENIMFIYRDFQVWAWPLLNKRSTSKKYLLGLIDSMYELVTWCVGHVVLINNPRVFFSMLQGHNQDEI